ncbi:MAG: hypothetical protein M3Z96_08580 [Pseudomonadota bacterium]|nr:hypothetical protein [Pseudomonadota bacterium]
MARRKSNSCAGSGHAAAARPQTIVWAIFFASIAAGRKANGFADPAISLHEMADGDRGRIETRTAPMIHDVVWPRKRHDWPGNESLKIKELEQVLVEKLSHLFRDLL